MDNVVWLENLWNPFVDGDPIEVPRGWYWMPDRLVSEQTFRRILGPDGCAGLERTAHMLGDFFGPVQRDMEAESRDVEHRMELLLKGR